MSQIIKNENQSLLWNIIQQTNQFKNSYICENNKIQLFKDVMKIFYEKIKTKNLKLSKQDLENYNKQMIQTYLQELQKCDNFIFETPNIQIKTSEPTKHVSFQIPENNNLIQPMSFRPIQPINNKESPMEAYSQRQNEYETMTKRELPLEPNFKEKIEDTAIENMEELLQAQIRQRELDLQQMNPINSTSFISSTNDFKPSIISNDVVSGRSITNLQPYNIIKPIPHILKINEETDNIIIDVQSLNDDNISPPSWFKDFLNTMKDIKEEMANLSSNMKIIRQKVLEKKNENLDVNNSLENIEINILS